MPSLDYWFSTFLSNVTEVQVAGIVIVIFGLAAAIYPDSKDNVAVAVATVGVLIVIGSLGAPFTQEWHYYGIGAAVVGALVLAVDKKD